MDDDQILNRGGSEREIIEYAEQNGANLNKEDFKEPQVDFDLLIALIEQFDNLTKLIPLYESLFNNGKLFFKLLSTKPTFANKAYKELSKLNK